MSKVLTAAVLSAAFIARYPQTGVIGFIEASDSTLPTVEAQAVRGFSTVTGKLQWVKAIEPFFEAGETVNVGDFVEMREGDAAAIVARGRAAFSTAEEAAAAAAAADAKGKK